MESPGLSSKWYVFVIICAGICIFFWVIWQMILWPVRKVVK